MKNKKILNLIGTSESTTIEWKPSLSQVNEIIETIIAFFNTEGGKIFVGISKTGELLGIQIGKGTIENLTNQISQHTDPKIYPRITVEKIENKSIIIIEIKESADKLILAFGRPYKRVGKSTVKMSKEEYERRILEKYKEKLYFDSQVCKEAKLKDINEEKLKWFIKEAKKHRALDIDEDLPIYEILKRLKLIKDGKLTNAAILLFGKNPQQFFLQSIVKAIRFKGRDVSEDMIDFKTIETDVLTQLEKAEDFIFEHIPKEARIEEGKLQRQEKWLYPPKAIREALANALSHRNYETTANVQIRIFDDRLEIWNPGCLPQGMTIEKLRTKHDSIPRNHLIFRAFFWIKYVEEVGTGTNKIIKWCKEWELPEPNFEETGTSFVLTFRRHFIDENILESLNERQKKAIEYLKQNKYITNRDYRKINEIGKVISVKELNFMVKKDIVKKVGKGRALKYELND